jgi:hypothetical protein
MFYINFYTSLIGRKVLEQKISFSKAKIGKEDIQTQKYRDNILKEHVYADSK